MNPNFSLRRFIAITMMHLLPCAVLAAGGTPSSARPSDNVELAKAKSHFNAHQFDEAITLLERLIATSTLSQADRISALEWLAFCFVAKEKLDRVQTCFAEILPMRPDYEPPESVRSHTGLMASYMRARQKVVGGMGIPAQPSGVKTVAVLDFDNNSIDDAQRLANLGKGLADILITDLATLSKLKVVERERMNFILKEIALSDTTIRGKSLVDPEFAVRLGRLMGAQSVLIGSFLKMGKQLRVDVRLVRTETSEILKTEFVQGHQDAVLDLASKLALKVAQNLEVVLNEVEKKNLERLQKKEVPLEAAMAYAESLNLLDQERYAEAKKLLEKALVMAPNFEPAMKKMKVLQTFYKG